MAKALYSGVGIAGMSGSINKNAGGTTFSKNGVVRRRVVPVNPQTTTQQAVRAFFSFLTTSWSALSDAQRELWETARTSNVYYQKQDPLTGVNRPFASAKDLYIAMNLNYALGDDSINTPAENFAAPGTSGGIDTIAVSSMVFDDSSNSATLTYTGTLANENLMIKATPPVSAGNLRQASIASKLRYITGAIGASPAAFSADYIAVNGALTGKTGQKVFWVVEAVDTSTGKTRLVAQGSSIVVA